MDKQERHGSLNPRSRSKLKPSNHRLTRGSTSSAEQEDRRGLRDPGDVLLPDDLGRLDPDRALLRDERHRVRGRADRPAADLDADLRAGGAPGPADRAGRADRRQLPAVLCRRDRADRGLREMGGAVRPPVPQRLVGAGGSSATAARWW